MRLLDFTSWQGALTSVLALALVALIGVGIRVLVMLTIQQRQQRMNRQINERLKTLIAAYKTLGGSFTGQLTVDPGHLRDRAASDAIAAPTDTGWDRPRQIRDAVEAALSDVLLLGTDDQVRLAAQAACDMAAGRPIHTAQLVSALRTYIRLALDLDPIPEGVVIPLQGPTRPASGGARGGRDRTGGGGADGGGGGGGMGGGGMGLGSAAPDGPRGADDPGR